MAFKKLMEQGLIDRDPTLEYLAGVSVGKLGNDFLLDLNYEEDSIVDVDANFFMTESGKIAEIQASGEKSLFNWQELEAMKNLAFKGITELIQKQKEVLGEA
jgi:ribonuclease PH